jgi:hypothetical protein
MPFNPAKKQFRRLAADRHDCVSGVNHQVIIRFITVNYEFNTPISSAKVFGNNFETKHPPLKFFEPRFLLRDGDVRTKMRKHSSTIESTRPLASAFLWMPGLAALTSNANEPATFYITSESCKQANDEIEPSRRDNPSVLIYAG